MPPLRRSNALRLCDRRTDATDRPGRCHRHQSPAYLLLENRPTPRRVGFLLSRSTRGRAPSVPLLPPSQIDGGGSPLSPEPGRVEQRGQRGNSRARASEAREFRSRRRLQSHRENSKTRIRSQEVEKLARKPWDENSRSHPFSRSCLYLRVYFCLYLSLYRDLTTLAPDILRQNPIFKPTPPPRFVPQIRGGVGFYVVLGI